MALNDWEARLRRLGMVKGVRNLKPASPVADSTQLSVLSNQSAETFTRSPVHPFTPGRRSTLESLIPGGQVIETAEGGCFVVDKVYPLTYRHGADYFDAVWEMSLETAAFYCQDARLQGVRLRDCLFLDTETTGLAGAGTLAFMVGVAFFESGTGGDVLIARQYFLRDQGDEPAMLLLLDELFQQKAGLVTFNGRSFDLPLLDNRYLMNRAHGRALEMPHLDLLPPSRRLWRARVGSCALRNLEETLLLVHRTEEDVPGHLIPGLYFDYLQTGDAHEMTRVFYHNQLDVLSMVTLVGRLLRQLHQVEPGDHPIDLFSLGRWQLDLRLTAEAERNLRLAATGDLPLTLYHEALFRLAEWLKRNGRRREAVELWQQIATTSFEDVAAHVELAKHFEWHQEDLTAAIQWTRQAIKLIEKWGGPAQKLLRPELEHRLARLQRKLEIGD